MLRACRRGLILGCIAIAIATCTSCKKQRSAQRLVAPTTPTRDVQSGAGIEAQRPATTTSKFYLLDGLAVGESAIRGEHLFEWAEAVAFVRSIGATEREMTNDFDPYLEFGTRSESALAHRFIRDVLSKEGSRWNEPIPAGSIWLARLGPMHPSAWPSARCDIASFMTWIHSINPRASAHWRRWLIRGGSLNGIFRRLWSIFKLTAVRSGSTCLRLSPNSLLRTPQRLMPWSMR